MAANTGSQVSNVKVVGANGQISLGKQFAGRQVLIEEQEAGVWLVRTATVVPDNERWLLMPAARSDLNDAMSWATQNAPDDDALENTLNHLSQASSNLDALVSAGSEQPCVPGQPAGSAET